MNTQTKKVIREYTVEHFLRRLRLVCPRCGKEVTVQFSLEKGPLAEYEEEEKIASIKIEIPRESIKAELPIVMIPPGEIPKKVAEKIIEAIRSKEVR